MATQASTESKPDPSQLPPEALDLAAKLFDFARQGKTSDLQTYVDAGISANLTNSKGDSLLMLASYHGHAETVAMLVGKGAGVNGLNDRGQSPLAGAVFKGYEDVIKVLVEDGKADVMAGHPNALDCAKMFKRENMLSAVGVDFSGDIE